MNKKIMAALLCLVMIFSQNVAFGFIDTVSANDGNPEPITYDFTSGIGEIIGRPTSLMTVSHEDGNLKCVSTQNAAGNAGCIYIPLSSIDGGYYNTLKVRAKVTSASDSKSGIYRFSLYYIGTNKTDGTEYGEAEARRIHILFNGLTENEGVFSNSDYQDYIIDLKTLPNWTDSSVNTLRIDVLKDTTGTIYIDELKLYNEAPVVDPDEPDTPDTPGTPEPPDTPITPPTANSPIILDFESNYTGVKWATSLLDASLESGNLKCTSKPNNRGYTDGIHLVFSDLVGGDIDGANYNRLKIKVKVDSITSSLHNPPRFVLYYTGTSKIDGSAHTEGSAGNKTVEYTNLTDNNGTYSNADYQEYIIDLSTITNWPNHNISDLRIDIPKDSAGTVYIDEISLYDEEIVVTDLAFDGKTGIENSVPVNTKNITAVLSEKILSIPANAVNLRDPDGIEVAVDMVKYDSAEGKLTVTPSKLDPFTEYTLVINKNAMLHSQQNLYREITAAFKTEAGEFEYYAEGDGNSVKLYFMNNTTQSRPVILIATFWDGDKYLDKKTEVYTAGAGETDYTFGYADVATASGSIAEITVWEYSDGSVTKVHGNKVYTYIR